MCETVPGVCNHVLAPSAATALALGALCSFPAATVPPVLLADKSVFEFYKLPADEQQRRMQALRQQQGSADD